MFGTFTLMKKNSKILISRFYYYKPQSKKLSILQILFSHQTPILNNRNIISFRKISMSQNSKNIVFC